MDKHEKNPLGLGAMTDTFLKSMDDLWKCMMEESKTSSGKSGKSDKETEAGNRIHASMAIVLKNWQAMTNTGVPSESMAALLKGDNFLPEALLALNQNCCHNFCLLQNMVMHTFEQIGASPPDARFQEISEGASRAWSDMYEKEFSRLFQIPQLGLMRCHQEKIAQMLDKYNRFQANLTELTLLFCKPFSRSFQVLAKKMGGMAKDGETPNTSRAYYEAWVKELESHFMSLLHSTEYLSALSLTVNALADFIAVRDDAFEDLLNFFPVAKKSDMDEMARELYELKNRIRRLEKQAKMSVILPDGVV